MGLRAVTAVNRVRSGPQTTGDCRGGTSTVSTACIDSSYTGSADSRNRQPAGVGPCSTHVRGAREARVMGCPRKGVNRAGRCAVRHDRLGESRVETPCGDDSLADVSPVTGPQDAPERGPKPATPFTARRMSLAVLCRVRSPGVSGSRDQGENGDYDEDWESHQNRARASRGKSRCWISRPVVNRCRSPVSLCPRCLTQRDPPGWTFSRHE